MLAEEEVNSSGGQSIEVIVDDTRYDMKLINTLSQKAISIDKAHLGLISNYTEVMVAGPVFERAKTPLITLWDSSPDIEAIGDYVFGIGIWAPSTSQVAVDYAIDELQAKTAITVANNGQWSLAVAEAFRKSFSTDGGKVLKSFAQNPQDTDFRTIVTQIVRLNPDVVYAPLSDNVLAFWKQLSTSGYSGARISSDTITQQHVDELGEAANGILQTQLQDPNGARTKKMLAAYQKKYGEECKQVFLTGLGYDAIRIAAEAASRARSLSGPHLIQAMHKLQDFPGAAGNVTFTPEGSSKKPASMFVVENKKLVPLNQ